MRATAGREGRPHLPANPPGIIQRQVFQGIEKRRWPKVATFGNFQKLPILATFGNFLPALRMYPVPHTRSRPMAFVGGAGL